MPVLNTLCRHCISAIINTYITCFTIFLFVTSRRNPLINNIANAYKEALQASFPNMGRGANRRGRGAKPQLSEKDRLIQKYNKLEQDIVTYENNIGFFSMSKNSEPLIKQMNERIAQAKEELNALAEQIRTLNEAETQE